MMKIGCIQVASHTNFTSKQPIDDDEQKDDDDEQNNNDDEQSDDDL